MKVHHHRFGTDRPPRSETIVVGTCEPAKACQGDEEPPPPVIGTAEPGAPQCTTGKYCVPASLPALPRPSAESSTPTTRDGSSRCGCRVGSRSVDTSWLLATTLALLLLAWRRS